MRTFKDSELKTFEQLAMLKQSSLKKVLASFLQKHYKRVINTKEYVFAEGEIPVAVCAHMDTVFAEPPEEIYFDPKKNVIFSPDGLGADDRAGVFGIIQLIRAGYRPHIIFTTDEEVGGYGASVLAELDCPFSELKYIIELDRRGANDCVFYECENSDFTEYVESFGFVKNFGSYTDICELCPAWKVAGVNLSIGYRDEHSYTEVLFVGQMLATIDKVKKMLDDAKHLAAPFEYIPSPFRISKYSNFAYGWDFGDTKDGRAVLKCHHCGKYYMEEEMFPVVMLDKTTQFYCPDCLVNNVAWCNVCGNAFQKQHTSDPDDGVCIFCKERREKNEQTAISN